MIIDYSLQGVPTFLLRTECQKKVDGPGETPWVIPKKLGPSKLTDKFKYSIAMDIYAASKASGEVIPLVGKYIKS